MDKERSLPVKNSFVQQFARNINFKYVCFDRVILRGYIRFMFFPAGVITFLRLMDFRKVSNGVMRILTDQLNSHILKVAQAKEIPVHWWPSVDGGKDGAKQKFVREKYARHDAGRGDRLYCILTDKEPVRTFARRELTSPNVGKYDKLYDCRKPVKQYYIYFHDQLLGGPCYLITKTVTDSEERRFSAPDLERSAKRHLPKNFSNRRSLRFNQQRIIIVNSSACHQLLILKNENFSYVFEAKSIAVYHLLNIGPPEPVLL